MGRTPLSISLTLTLALALVLVLPLTHFLKKMRENRLSEQMRE